MAIDLNDAARQSRTSADARKILREAGYAGVDAVAGQLGMGEVHWTRAVLDEITGQKHGWASRLFWHAELEPALEAARREKKPILSLRMLGRLDEDLCCANSRFFRTILYADSKIRSLLRERFVLHWASVRPVPKLTVDFGDGRTLQRTITGNALHLVLDSSGRPMDCIPGLYGPGSFLERIRWASKTATEADPCARHARRLDTLFVEMAKDVKKIGLEKLAKDASKTASKSGARAGFEQLHAALDATHWKKLSELHFAETQIDRTSASFELLREQLPRGSAREPGLAMTKAVVEDPLFRVLRTLQQSLAEDGVRNEYDYHCRVHARFAEARAERDADALTQWVYTELFAMPPDDPWLGLAPADAFTAIDGSGEDDGA